MRIDVVTLFPDMIGHAARFGVAGRALAGGIWSLGCWNPRDFATDNYRTVDDRPYGGGPGMVMLPGPLEKAVVAAREAQAAATGSAGRVVYLSPQGRRLDHRAVVELSARPALLLVAGRYEGVDERFLERCVEEEVSIGDYVVSGGELPALVVIDAVVRLLPGVLNDAGSAAQDSFAGGLLDCPHYTRPEVYEGLAVPAVLLSGNHARIEQWRRKQALGRTWERRRDVVDAAKLNAKDRALLDEYLGERARKTQVN